jgi:hypothetical protein
MQGKSVKTTIPERTTIQQKENPTNVNTNTVTYASVAAWGLLINSHKSWNTVTLTGLFSSFLLKSPISNERFQK